MRERNEQRKIHIAYSIVPQNLKTSGLFDFNRWFYSEVMKRVLNNSKESDTTFSTTRLDETVICIHQKQPLGTYLASRSYSLYNLVHQVPS